MQLSDITGDDSPPGLHAMENQGHGRSLEMVVHRAVGRLHGIYHLQLLASQLGFLDFEPGAFDHGHDRANFIFAKQETRGGGWPSGVG